MKLVVQPEAGVAPIVKAIEQALQTAVQRGVTVRALIAHTNRGGESRLRKLEQRLLAAGVTVSRTADDLVRYHAKFMVADSVLHVFGFNFTRLDIHKSRSFAISTRDAAAVGEAAKLFEKERAAKGVKVRVLGSMKSKDPCIHECKLAERRLHVRAIVRDGTQAFVGSQSLRTIELDQRREAGLIINNPTVARKILQVFAKASAKKAA